MSVEMLLLLTAVIGVVLFGAIIAMQVHLCKQDKYWYGLVLPAISSVFAMVGCVSIMQQSLGNDIFAFIYWFMPSSVMIVIYYFVRRSIGKKNSELM